MKPKISRWIRRIFFTALIVAIVLGVVVAMKPEPILVEVAKVSRGNLTEYVTASGKTSMKDKYTIYAPASGDISRITLRPGDQVLEDSLLAVISPSASSPLDSRSRAELTARLAAARAAFAEARRNVDRAQIAVELSKSEVERTQKLVETKAVTRRSLDQALAEEKTSIADVELAKLAMQRSRLEAAAISASLADSSAKKKGDLEQIEIRVPVSGVVLQVYSESGGPIAVGAALADIGDPSTMELVVDLPTQQAVAVSAKSKVLVDQMGDDVLRTGFVRLIEPAAYTKVTALGVEEQRVDVIVTMNDSFPLPADGFAADVKIEINEKKDVLKIPSGALFRDNREQAVFVIENDIAQLVKVQVLARNSQEAAITGLKEGQQVVLYPSDRLEHSLAVKVGSVFQLHK